MIQPVNQPPIQFDEVAASYQNEIQKQLLQSDDIDSPITAAFHEWVRGLQGVKTLEDVNRENLLEYQKIIFLCEHNLIFNLIFHNRFDLLRELLTEFESTNKKQTNFSHNKKVQIKPVATTTSKTPIITTTQNEELFRYLETLQREQPKLERWLNLYETLKQLEHAYADEQYQIDYDAYQEINQIVIDF
ncbi:MAG: hypothetical protein K0U37_00615, partial [Gammaproteobacteria bacterium]|nr:hypothetical protein [Gammaproteobacteria bacterium]